MVTISMFWISFSRRSNNPVCHIVTCTEQQSVNGPLTRGMKQCLEFIYWTTVKYIMYLFNLVNLAEILNIEIRHESIYQHRINYYG